MKPREKKYTIYLFIYFLGVSHCYFQYFVKMNIFSNLFLETVLIT